ncbi:MAG: PQQ-binding-like beta-propeller repeat protein [Planctomycetota bacterium]
MVRRVDQLADDFGAERWRAPSDRDPRVEELRMRKWNRVNSQGSTSPPFDPKQQSGDYDQVAHGRWLRRSDRRYDRLVGEFALFEPDGRLRWKRQSENGVNLVPLVDGETALVMTIDHAELVDIDTGRTFWKVAANYLVLASPVVQTSETVVFAACGLYRALDLATGRERWQVRELELRGDVASLRRRGLERTGGWRVARIVPKPATCDLGIIVDFDTFVRRWRRPVSNDYREDGFVSRWITRDPSVKRAAVLKMRCIDTKDAVVIDVRLTPGWIASQDLEQFGDPKGDGEISDLLASFVQSATTGAARR